VESHPGPGEDHGQEQEHGDEASHGDNGSGVAGNCRTGPDRLTAGNDRLVSCSRVAPPGG
jgi:hypothetical protein